MGLCLHAGGKLVSLDELHDAPTPKGTSTYHPIHHHWLVDTVRESLTGTGLKIDREEHSLDKGGKRYFGLFYINPKSSHEKQKQYELLIGLRNSHDKRFPAALACGSHVFVCDNLAMSGEVVLRRKHTTYIMRDIPKMVHSGIGRLGELRDIQAQRFTGYQNRLLDSEKDVHHLLVESMKSGVIASSQIGLVLREWNEPEIESFKDSPHNVWRLFNAYTTIARDRIPTEEFAKRTITLQGILDQYCGLFQAA